MSKLGFVVLHYRTIDDTLKCVNSIINNTDGPIVIVDNGSSNGSGEKLKKNYAESSRVTVLCLDENLGFAKGNNVGIRFLRDNYTLKFIAVLNNDTELIQNDFEKTIEMEFSASNFAVLGPQIINKDGTNFSNPVEYVADTKSKVVTLIVKRTVKIVLNMIHLNFLLHDVGVSVKRDKTYDNTKRYENVKLHGACWIFSEIFFETYDGLNPSTFLYFEEDILFIEAKKKGLKTVYNPRLSIIHYEDSSTNSMAPDSRKKNIFVLKNEIKSLKILLNVVDKK